MAHEDVVGLPERSRVECPDWCVTDHEGWAGEEIWVHVSAPLYLTPDLLARTCVSIDPVTRAVDGPHVLIGDTEYSPAAARALGSALIELAATRP